jgi:hypothetical protein
MVVTDTKVAQIPWLERWVDIKSSELPLVARWVDIPQAAPPPIAEPMTMSLTVVLLFGLLVITLPLALMGVLPQVIIYRRQSPQF